MKKEWNITINNNAHKISYSNIRNTEGRFETTEK